MRKVFLLIGLLVFFLSSCTSSYTITFESNGGTEVELLTVEEDKTISVPVVSREGYTLEGWYTSVNGGVTLDEKWSFANSTVRNDLTLYANWTINQYTITYDSNGGSSIAPITRDYNSTINAPADPTREGYTFTGWSEIVPSVMPAENLTLQAQWAINQYTISFNSNEGSLVDSITQDYNSNVIIPADPTREGYTFNGWDQTIPSTMPSQNVILIARWTIINYTITYNLDNGNNNINNPNTFNINTNMELLEPFKVGHTFQGWFKDSTHTISYDNIELGTVGDLTLYASWKINQYTITFDSNGGGSIAPITQDFDTDVIAPADPSREGYTFAGWNQTVPSVMPAENLTIQAKWTINQYSITFDSNGGSSVASITQDYNSTVNAPVNPSREGYTFAGWNQTVPSVMPAENITLTAKWTINQYNIQFISYDSYNSDALVELQFGETIKNISLGTTHSIIVTSTERVFTWGRNWISQFSESPNDSITPIEITSQFGFILGETITHVALGESHSMLVTSTGRVFTWGLNLYGQLGDGTTTNRLPTEITENFMFTSDETITQISLGENYSMLVTSTGRVFTWGRNGSGQLGDGTTTNRNTPTEITSQFNLSEDEKILSVFLGGLHSSALTSTGRVFMWGYNRSGQLGDGTTTNRSTPTEITENFMFTSGETIIHISLGGNNSMLVTSTGRVFTWGRNDSGQLGDGTLVRKFLPTEITENFMFASGETIIHTDLGEDHSVLFTSKRRVFTWGANGSGQLGDGTTTFRSMPIEISSKFVLNDDETINNVSLGVFHSSAFTSTGRVFTWGWNASGQLGDGTTTNRSTPTEILINLIGSVIDNFYDYDFLFIDFSYPTKVGHTFDGWYNDLSFTTKYEFTTMPSENLVLYGRWIEVENEVLYMTLDELSAFDGKDGANAYIAYNGVIYDVTNNPNWPNGVHRGYINAGQDVTQLFQTAGASHGDSNITNLPIVGYLEEE